MPYIGKQPASVPVTADDIPNDSITAAKIVDAAITIDDIGPNAVGNSEMADDAIGLNELSATGTTNSSTFLRGDNSWAVPPNTVYTHPNHSGDVTSSADGATTIANNAVTTAKIAGDAITALKIADDVINATHIEDGQILTAALGADAVTGAKIANNSINSEHYVDGSIDTAHLNDGVVTAVKIGNDAINHADKIADGVIASEHYQDGSIDTEHLANDAVTADKLANSINTDIATGPAALPKAGGTMTGHTLHGDNINNNFGADNDLMIYHNGSNSYINNTTGSLYIRDSAGDIYIQAKNNENSIVANNDGSVEIYYDNSKKLETTATGATVTGYLNVSQTGNASGLQVATSVAAETTAIFQGGGTGAVDVLDVRDGSGNTKFKVRQNGNVGIGTTSPANPLHIVKAAAANTIEPLLVLDSDVDSHANGKGGSIVFRDISVYADTAQIAASRVGGGNAGLLDFKVRNTSILQLNSSGSRAVSQFTANAWISFNGQTPAIRDSHNVSSLGDNGTGWFYAYIDVDNANANAAAVGSGSNSNNTYRILVDTAVQTTSYIAIMCSGANTGSSTSATDPELVYMVCFGD